MTEIKKAGVKEKVCAEIGFCSQKMVEAIELYSKISTIPMPRIETNQPCIIVTQRNKEKNYDKANKYR